MRSDTAQDWWYPGKEAARLVIDVDSDVEGYDSVLIDY